MGPVETGISNRGGAPLPSGEGRVEAAAGNAKIRRQARRSECGVVQAALDPRQREGAERFRGQIVTGIRPLPMDYPPSRCSALSMAMPVSTSDIVWTDAAKARIYAANSSFSGPAGILLPANTRTSPISD